MILAVDPGPTACGLVLYDETARRVIWSQPDRPVEMALSDIRDVYCSARRPIVAVETVQAQGWKGSSPIIGTTTIQTAIVVGRLYQEAVGGDLETTLLYRHEVLSALHVSGRGNRDTLVRERLLELHGGTRATACGTKKAPGPLYGVSGHAWSALAVAVACAVRRGP